MVGHGIALIGLGLAVEPHARALRDLGDRIDVRWAASRSRERCDAFQKSYPWRTTTDIDRVFSDPTVRTVLILTPPASHLELARRAAENGKNILIEKPLALTSAEAAEIVSIARTAGVALGVVLQHRHKPNALRLAECLRSGMLGTIEAASVMIPWWRPQSYYNEPGRGTLARDGGGVLITQAIHTLDLFRSLVGTITKVSGVATTTGLHSMETEDFAAAVLTLKSGGVGTLMATTSAFPGSAESIRLMCKNGSALLEGNGLTISLLSGATENFTGDSATGSGANPMAFSSGPHQALIADFVEAAEAGRAPAVTGEDCLATQRLLEAILISAERKAWIDVAA